MRALGLTDCRRSAVMADQAVVVNRAAIEMDVFALEPNAGTEAQQ